MNIIMNGKTVCKVKGRSVVDLIHASSHWDFKEGESYDSETVISAFSRGLDELLVKRRDYSLWTSKDMATAIAAMSAICNLASNNKGAGFGFKMTRKRGK